EIYQHALFFGKHLVMIPDQLVTALSKEKSYQIFAK
ncbi:uncharacterized protein METZ01_LOCUS509378, partial [marine metagenome]